MMTGSEIGVIAVCLVVGYWAMSAIINLPSGTKKTREPLSEDEQAKPQWQEQSRAEQRAEDTSSTAYVYRNWHQILEVSESASNDAITAAYKRLISQYHPDKVARLGKELRELAELKSKQINMAYEYATRLRG